MANGPEYACFKYPVGVAYVCSVGDEYLPAQRDDPVEAKSEGRDRPLCAPPIVGELHVILQLRVITRSDYTCREPNWL